MKGREREEKKKKKCRGKVQERVGESEKVRRGGEEAKKWRKNKRRHVKRKKREELAEG